MIDPILFQSFLLDDWPWGGVSGNLYIFNDGPWTDQNGVACLANADRDIAGPRQQCPIVVADRIPTVQAFLYQPTTLSIDRTNARRTGVVYDADDTEHYTLFTGAIFPALPSPMSWREFVRQNTTCVSPRKQDRYWTVDQIEDRLADIVVAQTSRSEVPDGLIDGNNDQYTLSQEPLPGSLLVFLNGALQTEGELGPGTESYSIEGAVITHHLPPQLTDRLFVYYSVPSGVVGGGTLSVEGFEVLAADGATTTILSSLVAVDSAIECISQDNGIIGRLRVSNRVPGQSFDVTSDEGTDAGLFKWVIHL